MGRGVGVGSGVDQEKVGPLGAHDEPFLAVEEEMVAAALGHRGGAEKIAAAPRLGEAFGGKTLAGQQRFDVVFLLGVAAVADDGVADQLGPHPENAGKDVTQGPHLLHHGAAAHPVQVAAAPAARVAAPHEVAPARLLQEFLGKLDLVAVHGQNHFPRHPAHQVPDFFHQSPDRLGKQVIEHGQPPWQPGSAFRRLLNGLLPTAPAAGAA